MCFGGGGGQTTYLPPKEPEKIPPRTDAASNLGRFQETQPVNAYGEPLGTTKQDVGEARQQAQATYMPYQTQQPLRY